MMEDLGNLSRTYFSLYKFEERVLNAWLPDPALFQLDVYVDKIRAVPFGVGRVAPLIGPSKPP